MRPTLNQKIEALEELLKAKKSKQSEIDYLLKLQNAIYNSAWKADAILKLPVLSTMSTTMMEFKVDPRLMYEGLALRIKKLGEELDLIILKLNDTL